MYVKENTDLTELLVICNYLTVVILKICNTIKIRQPNKLETQYCCKSLKDIYTDNYCVQRYGHSVNQMCIRDRLYHSFHVKHTKPQNSTLTFSFLLTNSIQPV